MNGLQDLALEAQQNPPKSKGRRISLTKLIRGIQQSSKLNGNDKLTIHPDIYNEALASTFRDICHQIESYDPTTTTVTDWANHILNGHIKG